MSNPTGASQQVAADHFTYVNQPAVTGVAPAAGPTAGATLVTLTGGGFTGATKVMFGTVPATGFTVVSSTKLTATAPAGSGTDAITVTAGAKTSAKVAADTYIYSNGPVVTGVSPGKGLAAGGTATTLTGAGFTGATQVSFGSTLATNVHVISDTQLTATAPAGSGTVTVSVTTPSGTSPSAAGDNYTYEQAPLINSDLPRRGRLIWRHARDSHWRMVQLSDQRQLRRHSGRKLQGALGRDTAGGGTRRNRNR